MKLDKNEKARPNFAGLTSQVQQAEMKLILAGKWPPLKPLPVFKYGTDEYRAEIYFDRTHGEWVCRKTSLPSNKVQELRGGLTEMTMALPHDQAEGFAEATTAEQHEQESEIEANRRLQAILDWRKDYENGVLYSELHDYLSESQQDEILDCIRMSLTAWQLQFNPKNIAFVFDALGNAGGRLATLIEIAQRNKAEQKAHAQGQAEAATLEVENQVPIPFDESQLKQDPVPIAFSTPIDTPLTVSDPAAKISIGGIPQYQDATFAPECAKDFVPEPIKTFVPELSEGSTPESFESILPTPLEDIPTEPIESISLVQVQTSSPELAARATNRASQVVPHEILGASPRTLVTGLQEKGQNYTAVADFELQVRTDKVKSSAGRIDDSPTQFYASRISATRGLGFRLGALLLLAIGFAVGFTVGLNTPAVPPETEESRSESQSAQSPSERPDDSATRENPTGPSISVTIRSDPSSHLDSSSSANKLDGTTPSEKKPQEGTQDSVSFAKVPSTDSNSSPTIESGVSANAEASPKPNGSTRVITRYAPPPPRRKPSNSLKAVDQVHGAPRHPSERGVTLGTRAALRSSPPSTILVTAPAKGRKSLRLTFPERPIAASSSFAITSQLSVLVPPESGPAAAHKPARLQAGELVSYVWPRYPRQKDRHGSSETVKVRATIGQHGEVLDVKRVSGSISLLPDAMGAIRLWRYKPTLLNKRPVKSQLDVTIEFRPPQYFSRVSTSDPSHN